MPNEIPDSDESDYEPAPQMAVRPLPQSDTNQPTLIVTEIEQGPDVNFDDFISQTQSKKDGSSQLEQTKRSTLSAQKHLREALDNRRQSTSSSFDGANDMDMGAKTSIKRAHSEIDNGRQHSASSQNRNKRTKTFSSSSQRLATSQELKVPHQAVEIAAEEYIVSPGASSARSLSETPCEQDDVEIIVPRGRDRPRRVVSLLGDVVPNAGQILSTSNSSIGGYQSINLDFRGTGPGSDIIANPFGPLSQLSVDLEPEITIQTSPVAISAAQKFTNTLTTASSYTPDYALQDLSRNSVYDRAGRTESGNTTKGRSSKSKGSRQPSVRSTQDESSKQYDPEGLVVDVPNEQYKPRLSKSRHSTHELEHQRQHDDDEPQPTRDKGRKKSFKSTWKAAEQSSPVKLPTSELYLSDEALIGLPKENYKPRPSRRRSKMIVEEDANNVVQVEASEWIQSTEMQAEEPQSFPVEQSTPPQISKKSKKAKVKRAKTSAAFLLKKSAPMISDGEEDVVWMDTKPAKVKLDLPVDPLTGEHVKDVKEEDAAATEIVVDRKQLSQQPIEDCTEPTGALSAPPRTVTVEIPARAEKEMAQPSKRGQKRKKTGEVVETEEIGAETEAEPSPLTPAKQHPSSQQPASQSTILQDKDTNTLLVPVHAAAKESTPSPMKQAAPSSASKPAKSTHSPINPAGGKVRYRIGLSRRTAIPPLLKIVKPPAKQQPEKQDFDEEGRPVDLVAETMRRWREMGALD